MKRAVSIVILILSAAVLLAACSAESTATVSFTPAPAAESAPQVTPVPEFTVAISELMATNAGFVSDGGSAFPDWIELYNYGTLAVDLSGAVISTGSGSATLTEGQIQPGGYTVIWCGTSTASPRADVRLSKYGDSVTLTGPLGEPADSVSFGICSKNTSVVISGGTPVETKYPTPGYENSDSGWSAWQSSLVPSGIAINEAVTYNGSFPSSDGEYCDWAELKNFSSEPVSLAGLWLSDDAAVPQLYALPDVSLAPGELYLVDLSDSATGFSLSNQGDHLFLSDDAGVLLDSVYLRDIPSGCSYGRFPSDGGWFYIDAPTPGSENGVGYRMISSAPLAAAPDGVFEGVDSVEVSLSAPGIIHYTTDGSTPSVLSDVYSGPITLTETSVIRAISVEPDKMDSDILNLSYIINEGHTLPVSSLVIDPQDMFSRGTGLYYNPDRNWERPGSISFFDGDSRFSIDCGVKLHGATSRYAQSKKSLKLTFRGRYDGDLSYDLFGNGITEYSSVLLRNAQESSFSTQLRDILFHELAQQCSTSLPTQDYKFTVLYINGEYWGLYAYREAYSAKMYADHYGYDKDAVSMYQESWSANSEIVSLYNYVLYNSMADPDNYNYVKEHLDLENLATWVIIQSYSGNLDINPPNMRFLWSEEDQIMRYALVDLDLSFFTYASFDSSLYTGYVYSVLPRELLRNAEFRQLMIDKLSEYLHGPLSDANVTATISALAAEIRPEIPRDAQRWGYSLEVWEHGLDAGLYRLCTEDYDHARVFASSAASYLGMSSAEQNAVFGDLP